MKSHILAVLFSCSVLISAQASFIEVQSGGSLIPGASLGGTVTYEGWNDLKTDRIPNPSATGGVPNPGPATTRPYGSHSNTTGWYHWVWDGSAYVPTFPATIASNLGSGSSTLWKNSGYGYVASSSIHQGFGGFAILPGGSFELATTAMANLETIVFQMQVTDRAGQVFSALPTLSFGSTTVVADLSVLYEQTYFGESFGEPQYMNYYAFQWDLQDYVIAEGEALTLNWTGITNSGIYALQLNQGDVFAQVVPEPSSFFLGSLAGVALLVLRRRYRR